MASVRQYFETDFNHVVRIHVKFAVPGEAEVEGSLALPSRRHSFEQKNA
jgi:hypothetical protein